MQLKASKSSLNKPAVDESSSATTQAMETESETKEPTKTECAISVTEVQALRDEIAEKEEALKKLKKAVDEGKEVSAKREEKLRMSLESLTSKHERIVGQLRQQNSALQEKVKAAQEQVSSSKEELQKMVARTREDDY